ncbi:3787_t:CDS:1, partial [Diversispora eburnea]
MPCYADMIIKINQVRQSDKDGSSLTVVWAVGTYPVGIDDCEMELVLFVPMSHYDRDPNIQSVFRKDEYYSVGGK